MKSPLCVLRGQIDPNLAGNKGTYLLQSAAAAGYIFLVYLILDALREGWAIAPLAASTFIAFSFPKAVSSRPRYLIGGYFIAALVGPLFSALLRVSQRREVPEAHVICCALALFAAMMIMIAVDCEHPPAAAMAITLVLTDDPLPVGVAGLLCVMLLCAIKRLLRPWLKNL